MASIASSCVAEIGDDIISEPAQANLDLTLAVDSLQSKAIVSSLTLPVGSKVGVFVEDLTGNGLYQGHDYKNVMYTSSGNKLTGPSKKVMLTPTTGRAYAYYPYVANATLTSLSINTGSQTDFMYSGVRSGLSYSNYKATFSMKHAMAALTLNIVKGDYDGNCQVTAVQISGSNLATSGTYNGKTGAILTRNGTNGTIRSTEGSFTLNTSGTTRNILLIPAAASATATVKITLDGYTRAVSIPSFMPSAGKRYRYTLTVNEMEIVVSAVSVNSWSEIVSSYQVYITGDTKYIAISHSVNEDGSVEVMTYPLLPIETVNEVTVSGSAKSEQTLNESLRGRRILLSSITSDVYLKFNGLSKSYVVCKYLFPESYTSDLVFWDEDAAMPVKHMTLNDDYGERVMPYNGLTGKELEVKIWLNKLSSDTLPYDWFGSAFFKNVRGSYLTYWEIPEGIVSTEASSSGIGTYLSAHLKFPQSLKMINNYSFMNTKVPGVEFHPDSEVTIGKRAFYSSQVSSVQFPKKMTLSFGEQFANCPFSGKLTIPTWNLLASQSGDSRFRYTDITALILEEGITILSPSAYYGYNFADCTSLQSVDLPSTLALLGCYEFKNCTSLSRITSRATSAPTVQTSFGYRTFDQVKSGGQLIVPEGATGYEEWLEAGLTDWTIVYSSSL